MKILLLCFILLILTSCEAFKRGEKGKHKRDASKQHIDAPKAELVDMKVEIRHRPETCEDKTTSGDKVNMHYTGYLEDGSIFDSSVQRDTPFSFRLGVGEVIPGWDRGLQGMCIGEKRRLVIPPHFAYGEPGYPPVIPRNIYIPLK